MKQASGGLAGPKRLWGRQPGHVVIMAAALFTLLGLVIQVWRLQSLTASYDQGIFLQVIWNGLSGHPFQSTLSSQLSTNVIHAGELPATTYHRLGQHFTPALLLWVPLVGLLGKWALPLIQVGLVTGAGLALHRLALTRLEPVLAALISVSWYAANAVLGPTWSNFHDICQLPLLVFLLVLGIVRRRCWLIVPCVLFLPMIREDSGVALLSIAVWAFWRRHLPSWAALLICGYASAYLLWVSSWAMPQFSDDVARRWAGERFGQYLGEGQEAGAFEILLALLRQPLLVLREVISPFGRTFRYLLGQWLPLLFVPAIALDSWLLAGLPLLQLLLLDGQSALAINIRYAMSVVPGLFAGAVFWWQFRQPRFASLRLRRFWTAAIALSLFFTLTSNPNRSLSFLVPDSIQPWVHVPLTRQWSHGQQALALLQRIPANASVAANTPLVPHLAARRAIVRFPLSVAFLDDRGRPTPVDVVAADIGGRLPYVPAFAKSRGEVQGSLERIPWLRTAGYGLVEVRDGVVLLQHGVADTPGAEEALEVLFRQARQALSLR